MRHVLLRGFILFMIACANNEENGIAITRQGLPDHESWNATIILTREGKKRAVVKAGHIAKYNDKREVILDRSVDADFFSTDERHMSNLKSEKAWVYEATDNLLAMGNVVVVSDSGVTLFTDSLFWDHKAEQVTTNDTVMLTTQSRDTLHGIGFESNVDLTHWKIYKPWGVTER